MSPFRLPIFTHLQLCLCCSGYNIRFLLRASPSFFLCSMELGWGFSLFILALQVLYMPLGGIFCHIVALQNWKCSNNTLCSTRIVWWLPRIVNLQGGRQPAGTNFTHPVAPADATIFPVLTSVSCVKIMRVAITCWGGAPKMPKGKHFVGNVIELSTLT